MGKGTYAVLFRSHVRFGDPSRNRYFARDELNRTKNPKNQDKTAPARKTRADAHFWRVESWCGICCIFGFLVITSSRHYVITSLKALRHFGTMALRHYGTMALWHYGTTALWHYGIMTLCHYGTTTPGVPVGTSGYQWVPGAPRRPRPNQRCCLHL